jgi:hypothetical protein
METKQHTYVELAATCDASFHNWRGKTRIQLKETRETMLEVSEVDTTELLRGVSYFIRSLCQDSDRNETDTRILKDMLTVMETNLKEITA